MKKKTVISWFSSGVSSAVATKMAIDDVDRIIYTHIDDQHPDTMRFIKDCEQWFGKPVEIMQSYLGSVEGACKAAGGRGYVNGPAGAACTRLLKRRVRKEWELDNESLNLAYIWGMDAGEGHRCERLRESMPDQEHRFPLVDQKIHKAEAHRILKASDIKRPAMYDMGYVNNNCVGCVKGGQGYWNAIRRDFPEVFEQRAKMERFIQATCIKDVYLDELDPEAGRHSRPIVDDCGIFCELMALDGSEDE